jgi:hypothetical protein
LTPDSFEEVEKTAKHTDEMEKRASLALTFSENQNEHIILKIMLEIY